MHVVFLRNMSGFKVTLTALVDEAYGASFDTLIYSTREVLWRDRIGKFDLPGRAVGLF